MFEQLALFRSKPEAPPTRERYVQIGPRIINYVLRQGKHRRLSMTIDERGLRVGAPMHVRVADVEDFIRTNGSWVVEKLDEYANITAPRQLTIRDGARIPLLSGEATIQVVPGSNRIRWVGDTLLLEARSGAPLDALARRGLQKRALSLFGERMKHYAAMMGRTPPALALSSARTRWGSCSSQTGIRLNWRLIHLPLPLIDYVVAHELAHLIEMNHSARFWSEVGKLYPDWRQARDDLKAATTSIPII